MKAKTAKRYNKAGRKPTRGQMRRNRSGHNTSYSYPKGKQSKTGGAIAPAVPLIEPGIVPGEYVVQATDRGGRVVYKYTGRQLDALATRELRRLATENEIKGSWSKNAEELRSLLGKVTL